ncbi:MAG: DUF4197 domain-containing protein [Proteobacteria bacterium]|nr:DUF4197 domain-containing protein [Pseudomonadota bacterium]
MLQIHKIFFVAAVLAVSWASPLPAQTLFDQGKNLIKGLGGGTSAPAASLTSDQITGGLRDALRVGTERVVGTLGRADGFNASPDVHIPLPDSLKLVKTTLTKVGMSGLVDDLELRLNRAAEAAVPNATKLFGDAIAAMSIDDANGILNGPKDAATQYFKSKMSAPLAADMKPIVDQQLAGVGAIAAYDKMIAQYKSLPFVPDAKANLTDHVLSKGIDGVFLYLAKEEAAIRDNPAKQTTDLLQKVFAK